MTKQQNWIGGKFQNIPKNESIPIGGYKWEKPPPPFLIQPKMLAVVLLCLIGSSSAFVPRKFHERIAREAVTTTEEPSTTTRTPSVTQLLFGRIEELDAALERCIGQNDTEFLMPSMARRAIFYCAENHPELRPLAAIINLPTDGVSEICETRPEHPDIPSQLKEAAAIFSNGTLGNVLAYDVCDVLNATVQVGCAFPHQLDCSKDFTSEQISQRFYAQFYVFQQLIRNNSGEFECPNVPQLNPLLYKQNFNSSADDYLSAPLKCPRIVDDEPEDSTTPESPSTSSPRARLLIQNDDSDSRFRREVDNQIHRMAFIGHRARRSISRI